MKFIDMKVKGVIVDASTLLPLIILKDAEEKRILPLWVGVLEAASILMSLEGIKPDRPLTHDMTKTMVASLGASIRDVTIRALKDNVFYASIYVVSSSGELMEIDAKPSDAIALALGCDVPIRVKESVIRDARVIDLGIEAAEKTGGSEFADFLENLPVEDFGKYKM